MLCFSCACLLLIKLPRLRMLIFWSMMQTRTTRVLSNSFSNAVHKYGTNWEKWIWKCCSSMQNKSTDASVHSSSFLTIVCQISSTSIYRVYLCSSCSFDYVCAQHWLVGQYTSWRRRHWIGASSKRGTIFHDATGCACRSRSPASERHARSSNVEKRSRVQQPAEEKELKPSPG